MNIKELGLIKMSKHRETTVKDDIEYLEKAFKKWTPNILTTPYIPTPTILLKTQKLEDGKEVITEEELKIIPTTKPSSNDPNKNYDQIISFLHKGAVAYSSGDYGTAINYFTKLLETDWLRYSSYFYLVKTLIKLDIEKEILSLRSNGQVNNIRMKKTTETQNA